MIFFCRFIALDVIVELLECYIIMKGSLSHVLCVCATVEIERSPPRNCTQHMRWQRQFRLCGDHNVIFGMNIIMQAPFCGFGYRESVPIIAFCGHSRFSPMSFLRIDCKYNNIDNIICCVSKL